MPAAAALLAAALAGAVGAVRSGGRGRLEVDLSDLSLRELGGGAAPAWPATPLLGARLADGTEVACLNCDESLFGAWVEDVSSQHGVQNWTSLCGSSNAAAGLGDSNSTASKHPNAPGYQDWAQGKKGSFLSARSAVEGGRDAAWAGGGPCSVTTSYLQHTDMEAMKPRLRQLWTERRLVVGAGPNPLHQRLGFAEVLLKVARSSPALTPSDSSDCWDRRSPSCGALLSDLQPVAQAWQLQEALSATFGAAFLQGQAADARLSVADQWARVRTLLAALKHSFQFYRQGCLTAGGAAGRCEAQAASELVGQIACGPEDDTDAAVCVYAELRRCKGCERGARSFFEYSRLHGPLALLATRHSRRWVLGQCEEFSRAAFALLASLGYTARYVLDFTDHVWVEVRLPRGEGGGAEWVHADPSEGVLDSPLMYEQGWGKKLTMIFAFTPWSVEHVTARYTADYQATISRRGVTDAVLEKVVAEVHWRLKHELPINSWGYATGWRSGNRTLEDVSLWSHF